MQEEKDKLNTDTGAESAGEPAAQPEVADVPQESPAPQQRKAVSPMRQVMLRFFRSKLSVIGLTVLLALFLFSFLGPVFSPWGETEADETEGSITYSEKPIQITQTDENGVVTETEVWLVTIDVATRNMKAFPSAKHWLGTDEEGQDVLTRLMYGGRVSLTIGFLVIFAETILGVILGGLAGYFGKWVDQLIMRIVDIFSCIPMLPILLIASVAIESLGVEPTSRIYYLMGMMTIFGWAGTARMVRGQILSLREQDAMIAAESLGFSAPRQIFKHLIPNVMPQLIVSMTLGLGGIILYEASLSWLGLGVPYPLATWGSMIKSATDNTDILSNYFHIWLPAGLCIVLAVLAFNFIGDGLRDAFDPKGKRL